jgi:hypothetical protein
LLRFKFHSLFAATSKMYVMPSGLTGGTDTACGVPKRVKMSMMTVPVGVVNPLPRAAAPPPAAAASSKMSVAAPREKEVGAGDGTPVGLNVGARVGGTYTVGSLVGAYDGVGVLGSHGQKRM